MKGIFFKNRRTRTRFEGIFGFTPSASEERVRELEQRDVDKHLSCLAHICHSLYQREDALYTDATDDNTVQSIRAKILELRPEIENAKLAFWQAHGSARAADFAVKPAYGDYLPAAEARRRYR